MASSTSLRVKELLRKRNWTTKVLAEKTGLSESYLTHIKNGTRRWNEDALRKLAVAFGLHPIELFSHRKRRSEYFNKELQIPGGQDKELNISVSAVPVVGEIPEHPSPHNNQIIQVRSGFEGEFVAVVDNSDESAFCLYVDTNSMMPTFSLGDYLIISPETRVRSGDLAAVEFGSEKITRQIATVNFVDDFVVVEPLSKKQPSTALVKEKDHFRIIGKVVYRYQKLS